MLNRKYEDEKNKGDALYEQEKLNANKMKSLEKSIQLLKQETEVQQNKIEDLQNSHYKKEEENKLLKNDGLSMTFEKEKLAIALQKLIN